MPVSKLSPGRKFNKKQVKDRMDNTSKVERINKGYERMMRSIAKPDFF